MVGRRLSQLGVAALVCLALTSSSTFAQSGGDLRLIDAVKARHTESVRALVKQQVDVNRAQPDGATALHWAAHWDDLETADLLIRAGARPNVVSLGRR